MAHFYGGVHGYRGAATRLGSAKSGLSVFGQGWNVGIKAELSADGDGDEVTVWLTSLCA